jgi:hypothetical protein
MFFSKSKNKERTYADDCRDQAKIIQNKRIIDSIDHLDKCICDAVSQGRFAVRLENYVHHNNEHNFVAAHFKNKGFKVSFGGDPWNYFQIEWL